MLNEFICICYSLHTAHHSRNLVRYTTYNFNFKQNFYGRQKPNQYLCLSEDKPVAVCLVVSSKLHNRAFEAHHRCESHLHVRHIQPYKSEPMHMNAS
jgi:hypothetical protein